MTDDLRAGMAEATRLTLAGQLAEATATIQRTLGNLTAPDVAAADRSGASVPPGPFRVVDDSVPAMRTPGSDTAYKTGTPMMAETARAAAVPPRPSPDVRRRPAGMCPADTARPGDHVHRVWQRRSRMPGAPGRVRPTTSDRVPSPAGQFVDGVYTNAAGTRSYKLYIPSGYVGQALPLVVMLHGCTQTAADFAVGTRMNVFAEGEIFLVVYPEQAAAANGSRCWNWFQTAEQQRGAGEPSLIAGITQQVMSAYHVNRSQVYVAGLSAGGAMAAIMAATYPDLYAALGVHSGLAYGAAHDLPSAFVAMKQKTPGRARPPSGAVPLIVFHGDRDSTVAPANADRLIDQWLQANGTGRRSAGRPAHDATEECGQVTGGHAYTRVIYHDTAGRVMAERWIVHQAGHAWSGGSPGGSYTDPRGPDASAEMVRFFREHPRGR